MYIIPYWRPPVRIKEITFLSFKFFNLKSGRKITRDMNNLIKATNTGSIEVRLVLIKPNEKAQISETIIK